MIEVIYWTGTGNTKSMAEHIVEGLKEKGKEVHLHTVDTASLDEVRNAELVVLGCPAMGAEELEDSEMAPFVENLEGQIAGKHFALFGSYGWGSGEWMDSWKEQMESYGAMIVKEPLIVNEFTEGQDEAICKNYGTALV